VAVFWRPSTRYSARKSTTQPPPSLYLLGASRRPATIVGERVYVDGAGGGEDGRQLGRPPRIKVPVVARGQVLTPPPSEEEEEEEEEEEDLDRLVMNTATRLGAGARTGEKVTFGVGDFLPVSRLVVTCRRMRA
jgi:hypothetical protein